MTLAALSELLEQQEKIGSLLADDGSNLGLMRLRLQYAAQIARMSAIIGMTPIDRQRLPQPTEADDADAFANILERMSRG